MPEELQRESAPPDSPGLNFVRQSSDRIGAQYLSLSGLAGFALAWVISSRIAILDSSNLVVLFISLTALPMVILSVFVNRTHHRETSGLSHDPGQGICWRRCGVKLLGAFATLAAIALAYWLFPEYHKDKYLPVWHAVSTLALPGLTITAIYFVWVDAKMVAPLDGYWHAGLLALGRWRETDPIILREYALSWTVKGFYTPFMFGAAVDQLSPLTKEGFDWATFNGLYISCVQLAYSIDVVFGLLGYALTMRVLDAQIRSTEPTGLGWASAIICYAPFSTFIWDAFLHYKGKTQWFDWLLPHPILYITWGLVIIILLSVYVWATVSFGCRFSNLTNRGIIVDGPYRLMKHPAYVAKNVAWWFMAVPFVAHDTWQECVRACGCLVLTNLVYFIRARTEERHLLRDPAYVEYSRWIEANGICAQLRGLFNRPRQVEVGSNRI